MKKIYLLAFKNMSSKKYTILVVDDSTQNLQTIGAILSDNPDYSIAYSTDGEKALKIVENINPDLILLDVMMANLDGFEICERLKSNDATNNIPIIFVSAKIEDQDIIKGFELGASDYIVKPFKKGELLMRVHHQIETVKTRKQLTERNIDLQTANDQLELALAEIERNDGVKDRLLAMLAGDIKKPIRGFMNATEALATAAKSIKPDELEKISHSLNTSAKRLFNLFESMLEWSKYSLGGLKLQPTILELRHIIKTNIENLSINAAEKNIKIDNYVKGDALVYADEKTLEVALRNVFSNAIKFSYPDSKITVTAEEDGDFTIITISDSGVGIKKEILDNLFRVGSIISTAGPMQEAGTGLGLIITKELIERNNGAIFLESDGETGTKVLISLPIVAQ